MSVGFGIIERMFDDVPRGLDQMVPGPVLAGWLSSLEVHRLSGRDRVTVLRAHQRMASHYAARVLQDMVAVADHMEGIDTDPEVAAEAAAAEIRVALRLTRRAADHELEVAFELRRRLPEVWGWLVSGVIDARRARLIAYQTAHLPEDTARMVVGELAPVAGRLTTGQLAARIRRLCVEVDPVEAGLRYESAVADRRMVCEPTEAGTVNLLGLDLPPDRTAAAASRINTLARSLKVDGEVRSMDQLRADVMLDLLDPTATAPRAAGAGRGMVDIQVDLATLAGLSEAPGELAGFGPVIADIARQVAERQPEARWRYTVTDPDSGQVLVNGVTRRRPTAGQRREVEARDRTCVFPGCRMPAAQCDLDHRVPWSQDGPTTVENLVPLCRHDHRIRHQAEWTHQALPDGDHQWTSRLGHTYTTSGRSP